jgi:signal transduction histidine kinase
MSGVLEFSILAGSVALGSMLGGILLFQKVDRVPEVAVPWGIAAGLIVLAMAAFGARGFEMVARLPWLGMVPDLLLVAAAGYHLLGTAALTETPLPRRWAGIPGVAVVLVMSCGLLTRHPESYFAVVRDISLVVTYLWVARLFAGRLAAWRTRLFSARGFAVLTLSVVGTFLFDLVLVVQEPPGAPLPGLLSQGRLFLCFIFFCMGANYFTLLFYHETEIRRNTALVRQAAEAEQQIADLKRQRWVAQTLHDSVVGANHLIAMLATTPANGGADEGAAQKLSRIRWLSSQLGGEVAAMMTGLTHPDPSRADFAAGFRHYAAGALDAVNILMEWRCEGMDERPLGDGLAAFDLERALREAVHNLSRHSAAVSARISFVATSGELRVKIEDDGCGIAPDKRLGRGLAGMRTRASELGGSVEIASDEGGSTVRFVLPLPLAIR